MLLTPLEIAEMTFNSSFEEAICLTLDFRFFYYRAYSRNGDIPFSPKYMDDLLELFQSIGDLTIKDTTPELLYSVVNIFPGAHKTSIVQYFIAWCYLREIRCNFICVSSVGNLSEKILNAVKSILIDNSYIKGIFNIKLRAFAKDKGKMEVECEHPSDGVLQTGGTEATITGFNANVSTLSHFSGCVICDDPHNAGDTPSQIQNTIDILSKSFNGRIRNIETGLILILGQLVSREDFSNHIVNTYGELCYHFKVPALDRFNNSAYPQKFSRKELIKEKQRAMEGIGTDVFFLQKQQESDYAVVNYTLVEQLYTIDKHEYSKILSNQNEYKFIRRAFSVDTSLITKNGDPSAICVFSIMEKKEEDKTTYIYFLEKIYNLSYKYCADIDIENGVSVKPNYHVKVEETLKSIIFNDVKENRQPLILIEAGHQGTLLYDKMSNEYSHAADVQKIATNRNTQGKDLQVKQGKIQQALSIFCTEPNVRFFVVKQPELEILKRQLSNMSRRSVNDDIVDCISMFLNYQYEVECNSNVNKKSSMIFTH